MNTEKLKKAKGEKRVVRRSEEKMMERRRCTAKKNGGRRGMMGDGVGEKKEEKDSDR